MKFFNNLKMASLAMLASSSLGIAVPALAQTAPASTMTTPTSTTAPTCTTCQSSVTVTGVGAFGGQILGGFGSLDANGNLVATNGVTGTVKGTKTGGGDTMVNLIYNGPGCSISCGSTTVKADISAYERGSMAVTVNGSAPGMFGAANSGSFAAAVGLAIGYNPGAPAPTPTPTH